MNSSTDSTGPLGPRRRRDPERGSAMIIALMIMIILTLLGITYVVLSEQEERISVNARDHAQALYLAEGAANVVKNWFNNPDPSSNKLKPLTSEMVRTFRQGYRFENDYTNDDELNNPQVHQFIDGDSDGKYTGGNAGASGGTTTFEKPYRGPLSFGFWGRRDRPDVLVCDDPDLDIDGDGTANDCFHDMDASPDDYLEKLNAALLMDQDLRDAGHDSRAFGELAIEQIRVYRPPLDFDLRTRYGVATIEVAAVKRVKGRVVTRRVVREVLQAIPFPGPGGAIETDGSIAANGSAGVHWGAVVASDGNIDLPQANQTNYPEPSFPRSTPSRWGFHHTFNPASGWDLFPVDELGDPNTPVQTALTEMLGIEDSDGEENRGEGDGSAIRVRDPWLLFRAAEQITENGVPAGGPGVFQPYPYEGNLLHTIDDLGGANSAQLRKGSPGGAFATDGTRSYLFQYQSTHFPAFDYDTWKQVAQSGQDGMYYYEWDSGQAFFPPDGGASQDFQALVDVTKVDPGLYFFDTTDAQKPTQDLDSDGYFDNLTPLMVTGGNDKWVYFQGFAYWNSAGFDSGGLGTKKIRGCSAPSEPFLDDGIDLNGDGCICRRIDEDEARCVLGMRPIGDTAAPACSFVGAGGADCPCTFPQLSGMTFAEAKKEADTFRNGLWDIDLDGDGTSDASEDYRNPGDPLYTSWTAFIADADSNGTGGHGFDPDQIPHYPTTANQPGNPAMDPRFLATRPHEPFLNLDYATNGLTMTAWGSFHYAKLNYKAQDDVVTCTDLEDTQCDADACNDDPMTCSSSGATDKTTRGRDSKGGIQRLDLNAAGVMYCEGIYQGTGNMSIYGSIVMRKGYTGTGSLDVWFDEGLINGNFPPAAWDLPRVYTSARDMQ